MEYTNPEVTLLAITPNAEKIIEEAGRTCYLSFERMTDSSTTPFIQSKIKIGHFSILEHASATFRIKGASRAFTHQLVRHRLASYSQQSQRYVKESEFDYIVPPEILGNTEALALYREHIEATRLMYQKINSLGIKKEDARFILPNAIESEIVFTANFRELRSIIDLRMEPHAQWEIRKVMLQILKILQKEAPAAFSDYQIDEEKITAVSCYNK